MRRPMISLLALLVATAAGGCHKGPAEDVVGARLQAGLDQHFGEGTLVVEDLNCRGSQPLAGDGEDRDRLVTYFDATLVFGRDYDLAGWDDPNVGSLTTLLGATAQGVKGISAGGNATGDRLEVHGAVAWVRGDDGWVEADFAPQGEESEGPPDSEEPEPYRKTLAEIGDLGARLLRKGGPRQVETMTWDLERLKTRYELQVATLEDKVTIATADLAGSYHPLGSRLAEALSAAGTAAEAFATLGSGDNMALLRQRFTLLAIVQSDIMAQAWDGRGLFAADLPWKDIRALGALFPEAVQIIAAADSGIVTLADLRGRRVAAGIPGSGAHFNALRVFEAAGMELEDMAAVNFNSLGEAAQDFIDGEIDALVTTTVYPSPVVRRVAASRSVRLISLDDVVVARVGILEPAMVAVRIPAGTYAGQDAPVQTVGVTAVLVARKDMAPQLARLVVDLIWGDAAALAGAGPAGSMISRAKRAVGVTIPFHRAVTP